MISLTILLILWFMKFDFTEATFEIIRHSLIRNILCNLIYLGIGRG